MGIERLRPRAIESMRSSSMKRTRMRLTLVRHGETEGRSSVRYYGRTDVPLSNLGRAQMVRVREALARRRFAAVYSSTLSRSSEGARIITGGGGVIPGMPLPTPITGFDEVDFGEWEGLTAEEIQTRHPRLYREWQARVSDFVYPRGESRRQFHRRVAHSLREVLAQAPNGELLFVLHKGVIRCIVAELLGADRVQRHGLAIELGSIHIIAQRGAQWRAEALDQMVHLV
jgi:broad specificity phosphatase PhoE